jgi:hypothetical protein
MKPRSLTLLTAFTALATLVIPVSLVAQEQQRHRYHFVEVPTFGGPNFIANFTGHHDFLLSKQGTFIGGADTSLAGGPLLYR